MTFASSDGTFFLGDARHAADLAVFDQLGHRPPVAGVQLERDALLSALRDLVELDELSEGYHEAWDRAELLVATLTGSPL